ncbi:MAG: hypothetical protein U0525_01935 [Patescibacteria group bacterium]
MPKEKGHGVVTKIQNHATRTGLNMWDMFMGLNGVPWNTSRFIRSGERGLSHLPSSRDALFSPFCIYFKNVFGLTVVDNPPGSSLENLPYDSSDAIARVLKTSWIDGSENNPLQSKTTNPSVDKSKRKFIPELLRYSDEDWKVVRYLGYDNEEEFVSNIEAQLIKKVRRIMSSAGKEDLIPATLKRIDESINFAKAAYSTRSRRKSGESYYCHVLRTLHYSFDYLRLNNYFSGDPLELVDLFQTALLHDFKEDVGDKKILDWSDPNDEVMQGQKGKTYYLKKNRDEKYTQRTLVVSDRVNTAIDALTSPEMDTDAPKFKKAIKESGWPVTAVVKTADRLDNALTQRGASKDMASYFYKMYESEVGTASLVQGLNLAYDDKSLAYYYPLGALVSHGLMDEAVCAMRHEVLDKLRKEYGYDLSALQPASKMGSVEEFLEYDPVEAMGFRNLNKRDESCLIGWDQIGELCDIRTVLHEVHTRMHPEKRLTRRKRNRNKNRKHEHAHSKPSPFGIMDLIKYSERVKRSFTNVHSVYPSVPGLGPVFRQSDNRDYAIITGNFLSQWFAEPLRTSALVTGAAMTFVDPEKAIGMYTLAAGIGAAGVIFKSAAKYVDKKNTTGFQHRRKDY